MVQQGYSRIDEIPTGRAPQSIIPGAIVLEGGAWRVIYTQGALDALMQAGINFQTTIGVSGGAMSGICYVAGDIGAAAKLNLTYRHDSNYCGLGAMRHDHGITGFSYFFDVLAPATDIDWERFGNPARSFYVSATDCRTGKLKFFEKNDGGDFCKAIQASATVPYISAPVEIDGIPYLDGGPTCHIPYQKALDLGFGKIMVIRTRDRRWQPADLGDSTSRLINLLYEKTYPEFAETLRTNYPRYKADLDRLDKLEADGRIFVLAPSQPITISRFEGNVERLGEFYWLGYRDMACELDRLCDYLLA
ncbi:patatin-like phospholipase family protein [Curtanaerobium respiraculi]|uniref:patatin-like phospholipase family protein n=1 Tax=Curtanaerobium respiraculi TaxID=2949669 RepID=UPI0024B39A5A|nr:patatin family protein [Curtanaerobium respiraculi]